MEAERQFKLLVKGVINSKPSKYDAYSKLLDFLKKNKGFAEDLWYSEGIILFLTTDVVRFTSETVKSFDHLKSLILCCITDIYRILALNETIKQSMLKSRMIFVFFPSLNATGNEFENLKLSILNLIEVLVSGESKIEVLFKDLEIFALIAQLLSFGSDECRKVSLTIFRKMLETTFGLDYACKTFERFTTIIRILDLIVEKDQNIVYTIDILRILTRMLQIENVKSAFKAKLPEGLLSQMFRDNLTKSERLATEYQRFQSFLNKR